MTPGYGLHDLMVHYYGPNMCFANVHIEMDSREDTLKSHEIVDNLERICREQYHILLTIHYNPIVVGDPLTDQTKQVVLDVLKKIGPRITMHDFRMVPGEGHTNLIFDAGLPEYLWPRPEEIKQYIVSVKSNPGL